MGELNIEKVDASKFVPPHKGHEVGYFGYTPDDTDDYEYTVAGVTAAAAPAKAAPAKKETAK